MADDTHAQTTDRFNLIFGLIVGLLIGGAVVWIWGPPGPNNGPTTVPEPCVVTIRDDFTAWTAAVEQHGLDTPGTNNPVQAAFEKYLNDGYACQLAFPDESDFNRLTGVQNVSVEGP